jgi:hypothetical protein
MISSVRSRVPAASLVLYREREHARKGKQRTRLLMTAERTVASNVVR